MNTTMRKIALAIATMGVASSAFAQANIQTSSYLGLSQTESKIERKAVNLDDLLSNKIKETGAAAHKNQVSDLRAAALIEVATNIGATSGLQHRMEEKQVEVNKHAARFDKNFDFTTLTIENGVMAPVLEEGLANYAQNSPDEITVSDKIYRIVEPAKFVSAYPTWRSYLLFSYPTYDLPPATFLPQNDSEKAIWDKAVKDGWAKGVKQAEDIYQASYNKMVRDFSGMRLYKILLKQGLITPTVVAGQNMGVTGGGNQMSINHQVFRITDHSALNPNADDWKVEYPVSSHNEGVLK